MRCSIPVQTACSGVELRHKAAGPNEKVVPTISMSLSIDLPVEQLITALSVFQQSQPEKEPAPSDPRKVPCPSAPAWTPAFSQASLQVTGQAPQAPQALQAPQVNRNGALANLAPPPGLAPAQWETMSAARSPRVKVANLVRRLKSQELQAVFERYVGPVAQCSLAEEVASITFMNSDHAQAAIDRYDGGVLEVRMDKTSPGEALILYAKESTFRRTVEDRIGSLSECHLRRGEGWMTLFRGSITKQLRREEALNQIDFKGSIISITMDALAPGIEGMVLGTMVL